MTASDQHTPAAPKVVMFAIWFAILQGLFMIRFFAAPKLGAADVAEPLHLGEISCIAIAGAAMSMIIRWLVIPKISVTSAKLPAMIMGLALAEGCGILGMFAVPVSHVDERNLLFEMSVACVLLSAPIYVLRRPREESPFHQP